MAKRQLMEIGEERWPHPSERGGRGAKKFETTYGMIERTAANSLSRLRQSKAVTPDGDVLPKANPVAFTRCTSTHFSIAEVVYLDLIGFSRP